MACLNDHDFLDPAARATSLAFARRGISMPDETKLRPGQILYRIAHSDKTYDEGVAGAWWMTDATFDYLRRKASEVGAHGREDRAVRSLYRQKLAVPAKFGRADMVVRAVVAGPLRAWTGRGKQIYDTKSGGQETFVGAFEIAQLCIPGLMVQSGPGSARWVRTANYDQMLKNESSTPASKFFS